jgi:FAD/FMN-containing dehydrogenase
MGFDRRDVLHGLAASSAVLRAGAARALPALPKAPWGRLAAKLGARLIRIRSPLAECAAAGGAGADALFAALKNPYFLGDQAGLTQTLGWTDAWTSRASDYAVAARDAQDVAEAVNFARVNRVRLVVKGGGHSYFGNSNAEGSLLIWTRPMERVELHDDFVPHAAPPSTMPQAAVSVGAGAIWGRVYDAVATRGGRYVQGGGCLTVGVAGLVTGGGFGSLSKAHGTGAGNLLEAEVVTADGRVRIANRWNDPELFFALRGGGGATFGVITRLTLRTDPLPTTIGAVILSVRAKSGDAWRRLVSRVLEFYAEALFNPTWGEQLRFSPGHRFDATMVFEGLTEKQARAAWQPFLGWLVDHPADFDAGGGVQVLAAPGRSFWDPAFLASLPGIVIHDPRPGAPAENVFWASNLGETGQVLHAYQSAWLPAALLTSGRREDLADALVAASAEWSIALHTNKGLAGGAPDAIARMRETAMNPIAADAFALLICAAEGPPAWPGIPGHEPDLAKGRSDAAGVARAMAPIRALVPNAGCYVSESDYFAKDWQRAYWGSNYPRLLAAKRRYDPSGLFSGHHLVGGR